MKYLAESENFKLTSEFEVVFLHFKNSNKPSVVVGDFYGDPSSGLISADEKYIVVGGCGLIIYCLEEPFHPYNYNTTSKQFKEFFRFKPNIWWIDGLHQNDVDSNRVFFRFVAANNDGEFIYKMNAETFEMEKI